MSDDLLPRFESLILPHLDAAYTLARYLLRDEHDAQDAVQDAALRAFRHFASYRGGDARSWFLTIVRNCCFSVRRRGRSRHDAAPLSLLDETPLEPHAADADAITGSDLALVRRAVGELPIEQREVVVLRELHGLSYAEISAVAGIPIGTVMSRLARARRSLSARLGFIAKEVG